VPPAPAIARILVERGWNEHRDGNFYFPGVAYPRIHIVLAADAANYDRRVSIYKDVKTIEVQGVRPGGGAFSHVFWLDNVKQRYDAILVNTALALLPAEAKLVLQELLAR